MATIRVRVKPSSRKELIELMDDGRLRIAVKEPAKESRANKALIKLLARKLKVAQSDIRIKAGHSSRDKIIEIDGLTLDEITRRLQLD